LNVTTVKPATATVPLNISASLLPAGTYTLFARVTDPSGNVGDSAAGASLSVAAAFVALSETVSKSSLPASATANAKAHGSVLLAISNSGNVTTSGKTTVALFATAAGVIEGSSVQLATASLPLKIKPGKPGKATASFKILPSIAVGSYTVVAQITDQNGGVSTVTVGPLTITA
jgi:hypothetical protein